MTEKGKKVLTKAKRELDDCMIGLRDDERFTILNSWEEIYRFLYVLFEGLIGYDKLKELYGHRKRFEEGLITDERIGQHSGDEKCDGVFDEESPYLVPDEITEALEEEGIVDVDDFDTLEGAIGEWGFYDEYTLCSRCSKVVRTVANSYSWSPESVIIMGELVCEDCLKEDPYLKEYYIKSCLNKVKAVLFFEPEEIGFREINEEYAVGLHRYADDDPKVIIEKLNNAGIDVLFNVFPGQFTADYFVWVREEDVDKAKAVLQGTNVKYAPRESPAHKMEAGLNKLSNMPSQPEGTARLASVGEDGVKVNDVPHDELRTKGIKKCMEELHDRKQK